MSISIYCPTHPPSPYLELQRSMLFLLALVRCILSLTNGCWSRRGMPRHGIPDIGMPMGTGRGLTLAGSGAASGHCLAHARSGTAMGIVLPMLGCQLLLSIVAAGITHRAVVATGSWHCYCWLSMALFLLAVHGIIIVGVLWHYYYLGSSIRGVAFATLPQFVPCSVIFSACSLISLPSFASLSRV